MDEADQAAPHGGELDFDLAMRYVLQARAIGREHGLRVTVAIHDPAGHPVLVARGSEKWHGPYLAMGKARLAAAFRKPTRVLLENWRDRPLFAAGLSDVLPGGVTLNPGGYPILDGGRMIGAIGVGGGTPDQDDMVARRTVEALASGDSQEEVGDLPTFTARR